MKHRNPTHQFALLAMLASLSLSGCQWDSVLYDSYIAAFGENGAGGYDTCENMEYILVRDTASGSNSSKKLERSLCCEDTNPCTPSAEMLQKNPLCIAFKFDKCPLTASRCMVEKVTKEGLDHNFNPTYEEDFQTYCAEAICQSGEIECNLEFNWTEEINSTDDSADSENIETTQPIDRKVRFFTCIDPTNDKTCGASCPNPITVQSKDEINLSNLSNYFINQIDCSSTNGTCNQTQNTNDSSNEENPDEPQYLYTCNCPEHHINCDNKCIDPSTDEYCGITSCAEIDENIPKCKSGLKCTNTQTNGNAPKYECKCPENTIECNGECINPDTDTRYCGASGTCQGENKGESCGADFTCINGTCHCKDGYTQCNSSPDNFGGRREPTCIPNDIQDNDPIKLQWKSLRFASDGCNCLSGYTNEDNVTHPDDNGCEVAQTDTECGIVGINAVNCMKDYHSKISNDNIDTDSKNTICEFKENKHICNITSCADGYNKHPLPITDENYMKSISTLLNLDISFDDYIAHLGDIICIPNGDKCCGNNCEDCTTYKDSKDNPQICKLDKCEENKCSPPYDHKYCFEQCFSEETLKLAHITIENEQCKCENGYELHNNYCQPTEETLCKLKGETYKYCFGQCLNNVQTQDAHIKQDSENCECQTGYKQVIFGITDLNNTSDPGNKADLDNSLPGYCQKIMDQKEFCGYEQLNCTQYQNAANINKDSITCKDYACHFECNNRKCNWDNNLANGCEKDLNDNNFTDCNTCKDTTNQAMVVQYENIKKCIKKGKGWGMTANNNNTGTRPEWSQSVAQERCRHCNSGNFCRIRSEWIHANNYWKIECCEKYDSKCN